MTLQLGDTVPDFTAETTAGPVSFPAISDEDTAVRFPKGFTTLKPYLRLTSQPSC